MYKKLHITAHSCDCLSFTLRLPQIVLFVLHFCSKVRDLVFSIVCYLTCSKIWARVLDINSTFVSSQNRLVLSTLKNRDSMKGGWWPLSIHGFQLQPWYYAKKLVSGYNFIDMRLVRIFPCQYFWFSSEWHRYCSECCHYCHSPPYFRITALVVTRPLESLTGA